MSQIPLKKNEATEIVFAMLDSAAPGSYLTGETVTDTAYYKDGAGAYTSLAITDTVSEIGSTGLYEISLTAAEMNHDYIVIKFTSTNAQDNGVLIKTYTADQDDLVRSTTPANTLDVSATGEAGLDFDNVNTPASATDIPNIYFSTDWTTAQTESYATKGSTATPAQLLYMIWSLLSEREFAGLTLTSKKLDKSTAMTFSWDSSTNVTSQTRET